METKLITLDNLYGFGIYLTESGLKNNPHLRNRDRIICNKNNTPIMFGNVRLALLVAELTIGLGKRDFKLKIIKFDSNKNKITDICNFESMQEFSHHGNQIQDQNTPKLYQVITKNMIYYIQEVKTDKVQSIRYFVFQNGDVNRSDRSYGKPRNKQLMKLIRSAAKEYFYTSGLLAGIRMVDKDEIEISFKNSTTRIHIITNDLIININRNRKDDLGMPQFKRCIPFDQKVDKFLTIYSYVTKEYGEPDGFGYEGGIEKDVERVYQYIQGYIEDMANEDELLHGFKYLPIEFNGTILCRG